MPARIRLSTLEMLLPNLKHDDRVPTCTFCATDADARKQQATPCSHPQGLQQQPQEQRYHKLQEQCHTQHHHHLDEEHLKQETPKKGRDIGNNIFCKFCKLMHSRFKAPTILSDA